MDEYISINNDNESDIMNLCKAVDLHALMIQESYYEDIDVVESYIESMIYDYSTGAVQEADSEEVFIDPRVVKAAKVYKHNKDNPSQTVFIDPTAVNMMAYNHNSKEQLKKLLGPVIKDMINSGKAKHVNLEDLSPIYKLEKAEGLLDKAKQEKKDLEYIKNHESKDKSERLADLNKFMYDNMSDDYAKRVKRLSSIKPGKNSPGKKYKLEGVEMNDEYIMTNDDIVEESYDDSYDDITLEDVESYLEYTKTNINDAMELRDDMIQEEYEYEDLSLEDVEAYIESAIDDYNGGIDLYNEMIMESKMSRLAKKVKSDAGLMSDLPTTINKVKNQTSLDDLIDDGIQSGEYDPNENPVKEKRVFHPWKTKSNNITESDDNLTDDFEEGWEDSPDYKKAADLYHERAARIKHFNDTFGKHEDDYIGGNPRAFKNYRRFKKAVTEPTLHKIKWDEDARGLEEDVDKILHKRAVQNVKKRIPKSVDRSIRKKYKLPSSDDYDAEWDRKNGVTSLKTEYTLTDYRDNEIDLELGDPLTAFEFFDESYEPDDTPIVPRSNESIEYAQEVTLAELGAVVVVTAAAVALIKAGKALINQFITGGKYGRFPKDMKRVYDIIESENFEASENKRALKKAFKALSKDLTYMLHGFGSRWKITVNEAEEIRKLKRHVDDLYTRGLMLTSNKRLSDKRRVGERIEEFLKQGNKVLEILNKSIYKNASDDAVTEWMV